MSALDVMQYHPHHPLKNYSLDLVFAPKDGFGFLHSDDVLVPFDALHHESATFSFSLSAQVSSSDRFYHSSRYNFSLLDPGLVGHCLSYIDWFDFIDFNNFTFDECLHHFYTLIHEVIDVTVPKRGVKSSNYPCWYSTELIALILHKKKLHCLWKRKKDMDVYIEFKRTRAECIRLSKRCHAEHRDKVESYVKFNTKKFWSDVNGRRKEAGISATIMHDGSEAEGSIPCANLFASYFGQVHNPPFEPPLQCHLTTSEGSILSNITFSRDDLVLAAKSLKNGCSMSVDQVPEVFVKRCIDSLELPLYFLLRRSFDTGYVPEIWKESYTSPVHKAGARNIAGNHRPVSPLAPIPKLQDKLFAMDLGRTTTDIIAPSQHAYSRGKNVLTNFMNFATSAAEAVASRGQVDTVYIDFCKAFDNVDHRLLIEKLYRIGIRGTALKWVSSFITGRRQRVKVDGKLSEPFTPTSGVVQGSTSGPLLFLLFINDLPSNIHHSTLDLFADDSRLWKLVETPLDCLHLQEDIDRFHDWSIANGLTTNPSKCSCITFTRLTNHIVHEYNINGTPLDRVEIVRDLGIILDTRWTFDAHVNHVLSLCNKSLGFVKRLSTHYKSPYTLIYLFKTLVLPYMSYGSPIWTPCYDVELNYLKVSYIDF